MNFIEQIQELWCKIYKERKGIDYHLQEKDNKAIGLLLKKLKTKHPEKNTKEVLELLENYFKDVMLITDNWISKNISLPVLNSRVNEINQHVQEIRRIRNRKKQEEQSKEDLKMLQDTFGGVEQIAGAWSPEKKPVKGNKMTKSEFVKRYGWTRMKEWEEFKNNGYSFIKV